MRPFCIAPAMLAALLLAAPAVAAGGPFGSFDPGTDRKLPNGGRPAEKTAFPAIKDLATLHIVLERGICYGTCPVYSVDIAGDGTVVYIGERYVAISGRHVTHIAPERVAALVEAFRKAEFFWLFDAYTASITDFPTYRVSISFDGTAKSVSDYAGRAIGMPKDVRALEDMVDDIAGTKAWIEADAQSFDRLKAEGWDFRAKSDMNRGLLSAAASSGNTAFVHQLLAAGLPADGAQGCDALQDAANAGNVEMVDALLAAGAPATAEHSAVDPHEPCNALVSAANRAVPAVLAAILKARPDSVRSTLGGTNALIFLARNDDGPYAHADQDFARCAQMLIDAGIPVNALGSDGQSALAHAREDTALVRVLLKAGATGINGGQGSDLTPLMASMSAEVTQVLLEAGADPYLKDSAGETALDIALELHADAIVTTLRAWMATHPRKD